MTTKKYIPYDLSVINPAYAVGVVDAFFNVATHSALVPRKAYNESVEMKSTNIGEGFHCKNAAGESKHFPTRSLPTLTLQHVSPSERFLAINYPNAIMGIDGAGNIVDKIIEFGASVFGTLHGPDFESECQKYNTGDVIEVYFEILLRSLGATYSPELITYPELSQALQAYFTLGNWAEHLCPNTLVFLDTGERVLSFTHPLKGPMVVVLSDNGRCANLLIEYSEGGSIRTNGVSQTKIVEMLARLVVDILNPIPEEEAV